MASSEICGLLQFSAKVCLFDEVFCINLRPSNPALKAQRFPVLLFLGVFVSLVFFFLGISLVFWSVFCLFIRVLRVRTARKILDVFEVFLGVFEKNKEKRGQRLK